MTDKNLVFILGDQLSSQISSLSGRGKAYTIVFMCEVHNEATYVRHHKKKIAFLFSAMRHFAADLEQRGWTVDYVKLDDKGNSGSFRGEAERAIKRHKPSKLVITEPSEWRIFTDVEGWSEAFDIEVDIKPDSRFLANHAIFSGWAQGRKQLRMEYFYREMRKQTGLLMTGDGEPEGGKWNYDSENRKPADDDLFMPQVRGFEPDEITKDVLALVANRFDNHFGDLEPFWFAVTADQAEEALDHFISECLPRFGDFQDAMLAEHRFLYHAIIGLYLNAGLLDPLQVCQAAERAYRAGDAPLNAV
ncbi:MAG: cryptochrome/photolyase family protein, partial [Pseudomonadota bacterium]